jgi:hypothetical protein
MDDLLIASLMIDLGLMIGRIEDWMAAARMVSIVNR